MATYTSKATLDSAIQADSPIKASTHRQVVENIEAVAGRGTNAPFVQPAVREYLTTTQTWTIPSGVSAFRVTVIGGGGGYNSPAGDGGTSTAVYNGVTVSCGGGGGSNSTNNGSSLPTGGDVNIAGSAGDSTKGASTPYGGGGVHSDSDATGYGSGAGRDSARGGGAGGYAEKRFVKATGFDTVAITIGAGGADDGNSTAYAGRDGLVIVEY